MNVPAVLCGFKLGVSNWGLSYIEGLREQGAAKNIWV